MLHLAGHGRHTGENPLFSAVELVDGPWFGYDIDELRRTPSTVVLSACELGRVSVRSGEEAIGMSAAWLHAGARTVLSSPVLIADDVACDAMARWHTLLAAGSRAGRRAGAGLRGGRRRRADAELRRRLVGDPGVLRATSAGPLLAGGRAVRPKGLAWGLDRHLDVLVATRGVDRRVVVLREQLGHQLAATGHPDLGEDRLEVVAHGVRRQEEIGRDLLVGEPARDTPA